MRNRIILLTVLLATSIITKAQLYLGAKVGLNFANFSAAFGDGTAFNKKIGINGGATLKYNFTNTFGLQMDALYSQMGSKSTHELITDDGTGGTTTTTTANTYDFSYVQVPLFVNVEIPIKSEKLIPYRYSDNIVSIHLFGGGYFGYGIGNMTTTTIDQYTIDVDNNKTVAPTTKVSGANKKFNAIDFGIAAGTGVSFNISKVGKLTLDGRYLLGLANFNSNKAYTNSLGKNNIVMKNNAIQVQLGYIHRITKPKRWQ